MGTSIYTPKNCNFFGRRLRFLLVYYDISMKKLGDDLGLSKQAISKYCDETRIPSRAIQIALCHRFNVPQDFFYKGFVEIQFQGNEIKIKKS